LINIFSLKYQLVKLNSLAKHHLMTEDLSNNQMNAQITKGVSIMKLKQKMLLSLASVVIVSCSTEIPQNQAAATPSTQTESLVQSKQVDQKSVKSGTFVSGEHTTQGTASIVNRNGKSFLELGSNFKTSNLGPDLVVILHQSNNVLSTTKPPAYPLKKGDYVILAPLQKFNGIQSYAIPSSVDLAKYNSAVIWCRKFNATFGTATLNS
jgi:hypothetical protein